MVRWSLPFERPLKERPLKERHRDLIWQSNDTKVLNFVNMENLQRIKRRLRGGDLRSRSIIVSSGAYCENDDM